MFVFTIYPRCIKIQKIIILECHSFKDWISIWWFLFGYGKQLGCLKCVKPEGFHVYFKQFNCVSYPNDNHNADINFKLENHFHHQNLDHFHQDRSMLFKVMLFFHLRCFCYNIIEEIDIELKVNISNHKLPKSFPTLPKIFYSYSQNQFNIYVTLRNYFCYLKLFLSLIIHLLIFFLIAHKCLAIIVVALIFKLHLFLMIRFVERAVSSDSSCLFCLANIIFTFQISHSN